MGLFDWIAKHLHVRVNSTHERNLAVIQSLPIGTVWAAAVEYENLNDDEWDGVLFHDGSTVTFRDWRGTLTFSVPAAAISHHFGDARITEGEFQGEFEDATPLARVVPKAELAGFAAIEQYHSPMRGLFETLGVAY